MSAQHAEGWTRRAFLGGVTLVGTAGLLGVHPRPVAAEPPPETTRIRLTYAPASVWLHSMWPKSSCKPRGSPS